jgi:ankyrin repeat protein
MVLPVDVQRLICLFLDPYYLWKAPFAFLNNEDDVFWREALERIEDLDYLEKIIQKRNTTKGKMTLKASYEYIFYEYTIREEGWTIELLENCINDETFLKKYAGRRDNVEYNALMLALMFENEVAVEKLLKFGAAKYIDTVTIPLNVYKNVSLVKMLISYGVNFNVKDENGNTPLMYKDSKNIIPILLDAGLDINEKDNRGHTALHRASRKWTEQLLKYGANPNIQDNEGCTTLHYASNDFECTKQLLEYGANPNIQDKQGLTPLMSAVSYDFGISITKILIEHGADVNLQDKYGKTALMHAAEYPQQIRYLIRNGVNIHLMDKNGLTAYDYAKEVRHGPKLLALLK